MVRYVTVMERLRERTLENDIIVRKRSLRKISSLIKRRRKNEKVLRVRKKVNVFLSFILPEKFVTIIKVKLWKNDL